MATADWRAKSSPAAPRKASPTSSAENESYTYDADGNRLSQTVNGAATTFAPDASSNRLLSRSSGGTTTSYSYDPEGDVVSYGDGTQPQMFYYTGFDRLNSTLVGGISTHFDVNPKGQRLRKYTSTSSTWFAPDVGGQLLAETSSAGWTDYVYLNGRPVLMIANGGVFSLHDDQTGRPQVMTDPASTNMDWAAQNKPFDRTVTTNALGSNFNLGFPGQYADSEDLLWYNGARDYMSDLDRYLQPDPLGLGGGINDYIYASANPISNVDPTGLVYDNDPFFGLTPHQVMGAMGRTPDYYNATVIFPSSMSTYLGAGVSGSIDRYGSVYVGPAAAAGWPAAAGFSLSAHYLDQSDTPDEAELDKFLTQSSFTFGGGYVMGADETYTPGAGFSTGFGFFTPGIGIQYSYSWQFSNNCP